MWPLARGLEKLVTDAHWTLRVMLLIDVIRGWGVDVMSEVYLGV
jgi:hypothetical protein